MIQVLQTQKYSVTTSKIQNQIRQQIGGSAEEVDEAGIRSMLNVDTAEEEKEALWKPASSGAYKCNKCGQPFDEVAWIGYTEYAGGSEQKEPVSPCCNSRYEELDEEKTAADESSVLDAWNKAWDEDTICVRNKDGIFEAQDVDSAKRLQKLIGHNMFPEEDYDKVLAEVSKAGFCIEDQTEYESKEAEMPPQPTTPLSENEEWIFNDQTQQWFKQTKTATI